MKITIIGAGNVGSALGKGWAACGHEIQFGVRTPDKPEIVSLCNAIGATASTPTVAAAAADVVVVALPWHATEAVLGALGDLSGKTVIDCTNPLKVENEILSLDRGFDTSGAEAVAEWLPGAHVVKTMNHIGANLMADTASIDGTPVMFMAGDNEAAKAQATKLVSALGFEAVDTGGLEQSRLLEPLAMLYINQALVRGQGFDWALGVLQKKR